MKNAFVNIIKLLLSILIVLFIEEYFFKFTALIGLNLTKTNIITFIIYIIEFVLICIIYGPEIRSAFAKYQNKLGSNFLYSVIAFIVLFITMMITSYIVKLIANNMNIPYEGLQFTNIFNKSFTFDLIITFIVSIIIIPFVKVTIFVLGINNLFTSKFGIFVSGLSYALYKAFLIGGKFGNVFIACLDDFVLFVILSYIYRKNSNIAFSIITFILYELLSVLLINKII